MRTLRQRLRQQRQRQRRQGGGTPSSTRKNRSKLGKITHPARIVIIDNDETTGSYWPLYKIIHIFRDYKIDELHFQDIIKPLANFCVETRIFRPGILKLLKTLHKLRSNNKLDAIVMYTYQNEFLGRKDDMGDYFNSHGQKVYIPKIIDYCFGYLVTKTIQPFFNARITRPIHREGLSLKETDSLGQKSIDLVFKQLQLHPSVDLRGVTFIDDCYLNTQYSHRYQLGPLTALYIRDYKFTISDIEQLLTGLKKLYKTFLKQYINKEIFDEFMIKVSQQKLDTAGYYSECTPKNVPFRYDDIDLSDLATQINKYYSTMF